jgi:4-amino-4-deoxy-L-arabinose transferase-like glycosyltransferase
MSKIFKLSNILIAVLIIGSIFRLAWIIQVNTIPISDFDWYNKLAISLAKGNGYKLFGHYTAYEPIGYPLFISIFYRFLGYNIIIPKFLNVIFSVISIVLIYKISKLLINKQVALLSAFLYSIFPLSIIYTSVLSTEIIFTSIFLMIIYVISINNFSNFHNILLGILIGIASLIKPFMLIFGFVCVFILFIRNRNFKKIIYSVIIINSFVIITISPWTMRNYLVFGRIIPVSTNGGYNMYTNNNPYANGAWQDPFEIKNSPLKKYKNQSDPLWDEIKVEEIGKKYAYNWIINNPKRFIYIGLEKLRRVFLIHDDGYWAVNNLKDGSFKYAYELSNMNRKIHITGIFITFIYLIIIISLVKFRKLTFFDIIFIVVLFFLISIIFVFEGQPRYLFPYWPIFIISISNLTIIVIKLIKK